MAQQLKITLQLPEPGWSHYPQEFVKKRVLVVEFENATFRNTGRPFKWLPTYDQMIEILGAMGQVEEESWGDKDGKMQSGQ